MVGNIDRKNTLSGSDTYILYSRGHGGRTGGKCLLVRDIVCAIIGAAVTKKNK